MSSLTLKRSRQIFREFLERRSEYLDQTHVGKVYLPEIERIYGDLQAPELDGLPFRKELKEEDRGFDGSGRSIRLYLMSLIESPLSLEEVIVQCKAFMDKAFPDLRVLRMTYGDEAEYAINLKGVLKDYEDFLKGIETGNGHTLYDWVSDFIQRGERLEGLLGARATAKAKAPKRIQGLQGQVRSLLRRMRLMLEDEVAFNPDLPRDLVDKVFGFYDEIVD